MDGASYFCVGIMKSLGETTNAVIRKGCVPSFRKGVQFVTP